MVAAPPSIAARNSTSPSRTPSKSRSFSDPPNAIPPSTLAPSPTIRERNQPSSSKEDHHGMPITPRPSRRPVMHNRGLSLQMPARADAMPSPSHFPRPTPLSPQLDPHNIHSHPSPSAAGSPATSLPRHSRGLDFSRACTNLHHSTLAESSPDSSPVVTQNGVMIPRARRSSISSIMLDSPRLNGTSNLSWGSLGHERSALSSSMGSVNMMAEESDTGDSDEDASMGGEDVEDSIFTTPQARKLQNPCAATPFALAPFTPGRAPMWGNGVHFSPAQASLMKTVRKSKLQKGERRTRKSSSSNSGSGYSSMASVRNSSPPPMRSIEHVGNGGYFNWATAARSRRESLALGTNGLHLSSGNDSGDEASATAPSTPGVVRRPVTRRQNLLPKTKGFARIRAALLEEAAPIDTDVRREAETIRQVRERDGSVTELNPTEHSNPMPVADQSASNILSTGPESALEDSSRDPDSESSGTKGLGVDFAAHASRNSGGMNYWNRFDPLMCTPPPPPVNLARASSSMTSDMNIDSELPSSHNNNSNNDNNNNNNNNNNGVAPLWRRPRARSSASDASDAFPTSSVHLPSSSTATTTSTTGIHNAVNDDMHLQKFKRRREDDFDLSTCIKRRAVSPGMSAQNSPVLTQSPGDVSGWGQPPERKGQGQASGSREGSFGGGAGVGGSSGLVGAGGKKLGLQGMVDTNDGLMNMSIE